MPCPVFRFQIPLNYSLSQLGHGYPTIISQVTSITSDATPNPKKRNTASGSSVFSSSADNERPSPGVQLIDAPQRSARGSAVATLRRRRTLGRS